MYSTCKVASPVAVIIICAGVIASVITGHPVETFRLHCSSDRLIEWTPIIPKTYVSTSKYVMRLFELYNPGVDIEI